MASISLSMFANDGLDPDAAIWSANVPDKVGYFLRFQASMRVATFLAESLRRDPPMKSDSSLPPRQLAALLQDTFQGRAASTRMIEAFWRNRRAYQRRYARTLIEVAKGHGGDDWEDRCLAALMLQHQWVCPPSTEVKEHGTSSGQSDSRKTFDSSGPVADLVLSEGYSTTRLIPFLREFRRRLTC